jgi:tetratricopeptide (TPR) repeat protein
MCYFCPAVLAVFIQIGDQVNITKTLGNIALIRQEQGNLEEALEYFEQALEGYRELGDRHGEVTVLVNLARLHNKRGDTKKVKILATQARLLSENLGFTEELDRLQTIFN